MEFLQVDVFAEAAFQGNPLAVFADASGLSADQMHVIAREMNLSETAFVIEHDEDSYRVRIFTPEEEIAFAGHPTLGTAWALHRLGLVTADTVTQSAKAGTTRIRFEQDVVWMERSGESGPDLESSHPQALGMVAAPVGLKGSDIGLEAREIGRAGRLRPAVASAGLEHVLAPVRDLATLARARPAQPFRLGEAFGVYCFTAEGAGRIRARGFYPASGIPEDPGTGSAVAALGVYLADRVGPIECEVHQGVEMNKTCRIFMRAEPERVWVGGRCRPAFTGRMEELP